MIQALFREQLSNISVSTSICSPRRRWFVKFVLSYLYGVRNNHKVLKTDVKIYVVILNQHHAKVCVQPWHHQTEEMYCVHSMTAI